MGYHKENYPKKQGHFYFWFIAQLVGEGVEGSNGQGFQGLFYAGHGVMK
jgi:hypothetical protein